MLEKIGNEFELFFKDPRNIHRVLMVIPLSALASHLIYMYMKLPKGMPIASDTYVTIALGSILYIMWTCWVFMSNDLDIELAMRFLWCALLSIAGHRIGVYENETGGSLYFKVLSFAAIGTIMIFVVTGKTKNELKIWFNVKLNEGKNDKSNALYIANSDDNNNTGTG